MIVNKANIEAIFISLKTSFNKAFEGAPSFWPDVAMKVPSSTKQNDYPWFDRFPKMRKWVGDKHLKSLKAYKYTIVNDDFEATVEVDRNDIEDDTLGMYGPMAQEAGFSSKQLPDEIVVDLIKGSFENECFDGQYFCDVDHEVTNENGDVSSVSNKLTAALSCATLALAEASLGAAMTAMESFTDNEGRPLGLIGDTLVVGPRNRATATVLKNNDKLEDGKPNPYKDTIKKIVVLPWLGTSTAWFWLCTTRPVKPFVYQERKAPVFVSQTNMEADDVFMRRKYKFGAEARGAGGYGFWQLCVGSTGAG